MSKPKIAILTIILTTLLTILILALLKKPPEIAQTDDNINPNETAQFVGISQVETEEDSKPTYVQTEVESVPSPRVIPSPSPAPLIVSPSPSPLVTPSPATSAQTDSSPTLIAACHRINVLSLDDQLLSLAEVESLQAGDRIQLCAVGSTNVGSFYKARFTINGVERSEVDGLCDTYTIPEDTEDFAITAQVYHSSLGWR